MQTFYTRIGEYHFYIKNNSPRLTPMLQRHFKMAESSFGVKPDMVITIRGEYGVPFRNYDMKIMKTRTTLMFSRADYEILVDSDYTEATVLVHDDLALKHALMNLFSSFIVNQNWGLLIHSSCVIETGNAHLFAGQSGAGKSTAARLSEPRELLSDEATLVKISPQEIRVFNSPFRSEIDPTRFEGSYPLSSIQLLHQATENRRELIRKSDALLSLFDKVFYWAHSDTETKQVMRLLSMLVEEVPVYDLEFQKDPSFWELIS
jgi:hypothetical protein